jgi:hypothetical protein
MTTILILIEVRYDHYRFNQVIDASVVHSVIQAPYNWNPEKLRLGMPVYEYDTEANEYLDTNEITHFQIRKFYK